MSHQLDQSIVGMDIWHLSLPVVSRRDHGIGSVAGSCEVVVLKLITEGGAEGWGEASCWAPFTGSPEASFAALDRYIRPHVTGRSVSEHEAIMADATRSVAHCTEAKAALDTALLDLKGRLTQKPVWAILGGQSRAMIPLSVSLANPEFDQELELLEWLAADGVGIVKLKAGIKDHAFDIMRLERIARDWPTMRVRVDYNQGLLDDEALERVKDVSAFPVDFIEQPVRAENWELMAEIRKAISVPLLADESIFGPDDMKRAIHFGICDGVSVKIMKSGSLSRAQEVARIAGEAGLMAYGGDMFESGLAHLAGAHMVSATPEIKLGCEFYQAQWYLKQDILSVPFPSNGGQVAVPDRPGLGIAPDEDQVERYAVQSKLMQ